MSTLAEIEAAMPGLSAEELESLEKQLQELRRQRALAEDEPGSDLAQFSGSLHLREDPLEWQRRIRGEWD